MNSRTAPLLLAVGVVLGSAFTLYAGVPAVALAGWACALVAAGVLAKAADDGTSRSGGVARDSFRLAQTGSVLGVGTSALLIGGVDHPAVIVLGVVAIGLVLRAGATGIAAAAAEEWRSAAGGRIARFSLAAVLVLGIAVVLDLAGTGPSWTPDAARILRGVVMAAALWLAAFAVASRDASELRAAP
jgi:hypothetical protein